MKVYRIEEKTSHIGPFTYENLVPDFAGSKAYFDINDDGQNVNDWDDDGIPEHPDLVAAFPSLEALHHVVRDKTLTELTTQWPFVVCELDVPDEDVIVGRSGKQVAIPVKYVVDMTKKPDWLENLEWQHEVLHDDLDSHSLESILARNARKVRKKTSQTTA